MINGSGCPEPITNTSDDPAVSVVIATYNYAHFLGQAIDSALAQTFRDFEIIVIDDASTDDTPEVMGSYAGRGRVRYYRIDHSGATRAKNEGMRRARGRYVALLDSDDLWHPEKLERQLELFRQAPDLGVVYTRRQIIDPAG